ncbi:MAG: pyruvate kinase [Porticoccaceae bacterium]|nr:pyruvate kinase [Porticoccaceae bacterium]
MQKRTKIIATLGPASAEPAIIESLIRAGANVFRLNFSHGSADEHRQRCVDIRAAAARCKAEVGILGDLQGPKIRIAGFAGGPVQLKAGDTFTLDTRMASRDGNVKAVGVTYPQLIEDCRPGQVLLLDDGRLELGIQDVADGCIHTRVLVGGQLSSNKGINLKGGGLSAPALTEKDFADIELAAALELDFLAVSFPRTGDDVRFARAAAERAGCQARIVAKVERAEAVASDDALDDIIVASDAVMVARGDLGVEIGDAELIGIQKKMILRARQLNRIVITATQMMESMIESPLPTRAEVFDVANAVLDGTDAVMLSAETATGNHPVKVVEAMARIITGAEKQPANRHSGHRLDRMFERTDEAIAMAAMYTANHLGSVKAILCLTESGNTPLWMSRIRSGIPIYGISQQVRSLRAMCLYRGVIPMPMAEGASAIQSSLEAAIHALKQEGSLSAGDQVLTTYGNVFGKMGETNTLKIITVPE